MIDLKSAVLEACDAADSLGIADSNERAVFVTGYLIGGPLESDREIFIRVYNKTPEDAAKELENCDEFTRMKLQMKAQVFGYDVNDVTNHLKHGVKPKLSIVK